MSLQRLPNRSVIALCGLILVSGSLGTFSARAAGGASDLRAAARDALRKGDRKGALEQARLAREADGSSIESHLLYIEASRGQVAPAILLNEYRSRHAATPDDGSTFLMARLLPLAEGEVLLRKFIESTSDAYWCRVGLSSTAARLGKAAEAERLATEALALKPNDAMAAARAGAQCAEAHRYASSETHYKKALELDAKAVDSVLGLAHARIRLGRLAEAGEVLATLPPTTATDPRVLTMQAALAEEKGDRAAAEACLVQITTVDPADQDARMRLSLLRIRRVVEAAAKEKKAPSADSLAAELASLKSVASTLADRADAYYRLGAGLELAGRLEEAQSAYRTASTLDPLDPRPLVAEGSVALTRGFLEDALTALKKALDRDARDGDAMLLSAIALDRQGKPKEASEVLQKLLRTDGENAAAWHALGMTLDALGKGGDAISALKKASDISPTTARYQRDYGEILFAAKKFEPALSALEKAVAADPADVQAWGALARTRVAMRKYDKAAEAYEKVVALQPDDATMRILLGALYHEYLKNYEKALEHYNRCLALGGAFENLQDWIDECTEEMEKKQGR